MEDPKKFVESIIKQSRREIRRAIVKELVYCSIGGFVLAAIVVFVQKKFQIGPKTITLAWFVIVLIWIIICIYITIKAKNEFSDDDWD